MRILLNYRTRNLFFLAGMFKCIDIVRRSCVEKPSSENINYYFSNYKTWSLVYEDVIIIYTITHKSDLIKKKNKRIMGKIKIGLVLK